MDIGVVLIVIASLVIVFLIVYANALRMSALAWLTPTTWISALPTQGWVQVTGKARGSATISLITKTSCPFWQLEVKEWRSSGRGGGYWKSVLKKPSGPFELFDGTGQATILEGKTDVIVAQETVIDNPEPEVKTALESMGIKFTGFLGFKKRVQIFERIINEGDDLLVVGKIQPRDSQIIISGSLITPTLVSAMNKPSTITTLLWKATRPMIIFWAIAAVVLVLLLFRVI